ncbi:Holliday junction branch migration protein RuvA [Actinomyces culturomici]|uniref:Holliday junction branch migration protein RuvA n=1 Tax=Actinomyces culturomici TaxID=1926276 RepID=UPI000E208A1C|nr:Holliday junction branch migration protein RuvA [Actinomyces culturomici]
MIDLLTGRVASTGLDSVVLVVSGVGFRVRVAPALAGSLAVGEETTIHTSLVVREDSLSLIGFATADERDVFTVLQTVSGIGPRIALAALAVLGPDDLRRAVRDQDLAALQRIPGVGKKSAQRMALEIGDKLGQPASLDPIAPAAPAGAVETEVATALVSLGWSQAQADGAVAALGGQGLGASDLLRAALVKLGGARG